jgi:hypothetical protein
MMVPSQGQKVAVSLRLLLVVLGLVLLVGISVGAVLSNLLFLPTLNFSILQKHSIPCSTVQKESSFKMTDSPNATVMGFATGYGLSDYKTFVGSLRKSGFRGHVILAVSPTIDEESMAYLESRKVTVVKVQYVPCTHGLFNETKQAQDEYEEELKTCVAPYDKLKARWGRFPFLRDLLQKCSTCTGPVLITDVRDTYFQRDPFGSNQPQVQGLQVFQEHVKMTTQHWLVEWPVRECKNVSFHEPMLCSGTIIGTRHAMLEYLDEMEREMNAWMADRKCHFRTNGDDQSIHNYLYYTGRLPNAKAIPNGLGIVNTVGYQASVIFQAHQARMKAMNKTDSEAYEGTIIGTKPWITQEYDITDEEGYILNHDGTKSAVVHQYDRFGIPFAIWLQQASGLVDD